MTTSQYKEPPKEEGAELLEQLQQRLTELQKRIGRRFRRAEVRKRAGQSLEGLLADAPRKNGWRLAEHLGERGPRGVQRVLGEADWNEEGVCDDLRTYVIDHLGEAKTQEYGTSVC